jgi:hypothetical protein
MRAKVVSFETTDKALQEAAIRLAWYLKKFGGMPDLEIGKLALAARGLQRSTETDELLAQAREIKDYLLAISADGEQRW